MPRDDDWTGAEIGVKASKVVTRWRTEPTPLQAKALALVEMLPVGAQ